MLKMAMIETWRLSVWVILPATLTDGRATCHATEFSLYVFVMISQSLKAEQDQLLLLPLVSGQSDLWTLYSCSKVDVNMNFCIII